MSNPVITKAKKNAAEISNQLNEVNDQLEKQKQEIEELKRTIQEQAIKLRNSTRVKLDIPKKNELFYYIDAAFNYNSINNNNDLADILIKNNNYFPDITDKSIFTVILKIYKIKTSINNQYIFENQNSSKKRYYIHLVNGQICLGQAETDVSNTYSLSFYSESDRALFQTVISDKEIKQFLNI